jgi:hyperosmotically inducible protein
MKLKRVVSLVALLSTLLFGLVATALGAGKPISDDFLTDTIRSRLAADAVVKGGAIDVDVHDGAVVLKGKVEEDKQRTRAERVVKGIKGVKSVKNEIQLAHP